MMPVSIVARRLTGSDARKNTPLIPSITNAPVVRGAGGHRKKNDAVVAEQIALAANGIDLHWKFPFLRKIAGHLGLWRARRRNLLFVDDESCGVVEGVAAAMVGMEVRADYDINVIGRDTDRLEFVHHVHTLRHHRRHDAQQFAPARFRIFRHRRMAAGVEQHIALAVPQQHA